MYFPEVFGMLVTISPKDMSIKKKYFEQTMAHLMLFLHNSGVTSTVHRLMLQGFKREREL
jgi:hypothetical protein